MDDTLQSLVQLVYNNALTLVFATFVPALLLDFVLLLLMRERSLREVNE